MSQAADKSVYPISRSAGTSGMRAQSKDTELQAEMVQLDLLRKASVARRTAIVFSLSETVIELARKAIRRHEPNLSEHEVLLRFVAIHYGSELAERLRMDLRRRSQ
jgi:hypothetical protein